MAKTDKVNLGEVRVTLNEISWGGGDPFNAEQRDAVLEYTDTPAERTGLAQKMNSSDWPRDPDNRRRISRHPASSRGDSAWIALRAIINAIAMWTAHSERVASLNQAQTAQHLPQIPVPELPELVLLATALEPIATDGPLDCCPQHLIRSLEVVFAELRENADIILGPRHGVPQQQTPELVEGRQRALKRIPEVMAAVWQRAAEVLGWCAQLDSGRLSRRYEERDAARISRVEELHHIALERVEAQRRSTEDVVAKQGAAISANVAAEREQVRVMIDEWKAAAATKDAQRDGVMKETTAILEKARTASAATALASYKDTFGQRAQQHSAAAERWLRASGYLFATVVVCIVASMISPPDATSAVELAAGWVPRALVGTAFVSAAIWCARVYGVHRHNEIVNHHRLAALSTFDVLMSGAPTPEAKSAIVAAATNAIYSMQPTTPGGPTDPNVVLAAELVRAASAGVHHAVGGSRTGG